MEGGGDGVIGGGVDYLIRFQTHCIIRNIFSHMSFPVLLAPRYLQGNRKLEITCSGDLANASCKIKQRTCVLTTVIR